MFYKAGLKEINAYKGFAGEVLTSGSGTPMANPKLIEVMNVGGVAPEGLSIVSGAGVAVGIDTDGYLSPCDGTIVPYGIIGLPLRSTKHLSGQKDTYNSANGMDDLHGLTPTVYQHNALFQKGYSYKKDGATKALFEFKVGDLLRPITETEISTAIGDDTLPVLFGESKTTCPKTKAYYAGTLVKFNGASDAHEMKCARISNIVAGNAFNHIPYISNNCFDYDIQGRNTKGTSRNVWTSIGEKFEDANYISKIVEYYVTM